MKVAIPTWQDRVSPVLDVSRSVLLVEISPDGVGAREACSLVSDSPWSRAREIADMGADVVICGAVSRPLEAALTALQMRVIPGVCGRLEQVVEAFAADHLADNTAFRMPGCCGARQRGCVRGRRHRGGRRWS